MKKFLLVGLFLVFAVSSAKATTVSLDFNGGGGTTTPSHVYGIATVTAEGSADSAGTGTGTWTAEDIYFGYQGLGVISGPTDTSILDAHPTVQERLTFSFSEEVNIQSVTLSVLDSNDDFYYWVNGTAIGWVNEITTYPTGTYTWNPTIAVTSLGIGSQNSRDNFYLAGITYITSDNGNSPVPEPATMLLFGLGLLGLAGVNRRKK